jgi:hypothetical protein
MNLVGKDGFQGTISLRNPTSRETRGNRLKMKRRVFLWENSLKFNKEPIDLRNPLKMKGEEGRVKNSNSGSIEKRGSGGDAGNLST